MATDTVSRRNRDRSATPEVDEGGGEGGEDIFRRIYEGGERKWDRVICGWYVGGAR